MSSDFFNFFRGKIFYGQVVDEVHDIGRVSCQLDNKIQYKTAQLLIGNPGIR